LNSEDYKHANVDYKRTNDEWFWMGQKQERVYVAGPVSLGNWMENLRNALDAGELIARAGFLPLVPHTNMMWEFAHPGKPYQFWLYRMTLPWIKACDYLVRITGESSGSDREVEFADKHGIPVYYSVDEFIKDNGYKATPGEWY
jgi:nucleoside 2-deoxyribosyltransferase